MFNLRLVFGNSYHKSNQTKVCTELDSSCAGSEHEQSENCCEEKPQLEKDSGQK